MLYREIMAVCTQIHTNHINTPCVPIFIGFSNAMSNVLQLLYAMFILTPCFIVTQNTLAMHNTTP